MRAKAILLVNAGIRISLLVTALMVCRQTLSRWCSSWNEIGIDGLYDKPRSGRPVKVKNENVVIEGILKNPRSTKSILQYLRETNEINIGKTTLKKIAKKNKLKWKRVRKSLKSKRNPELFEQSKNELFEFIKLSTNGDIDLVYFDQTGLSLDPCVPYAWQPINQTIRIPCTASKRLNVVGFMSRNGNFQSMVFEDTINSSVVVECINQFVKTITKPTILTLDNASIHTSNEFKENIEDWKALGLTIYYIAPYSPELNLIEILWRKIKYEWLPFSAYNSFNDLRESLFQILANIGVSYTIKFS